MTASFFFGAAVGRGRGLPPPSVASQGPPGLTHFQNTVILVRSTRLESMRPVGRFRALSGAGVVRSREDQT